MYKPIWICRIELWLRHQTKQGPPEQHMRRHASHGQSQDNVVDPKQRCPRLGCGIQLEVIVPKIPPVRPRLDQADQRTVRSANCRDAPLTTADRLLPVRTQQRSGARECPGSIVDPDRHRAYRGTMQMKVL